MSHESVRERLGDYLEGDLELAARAEVDEHVAGCESCRHELRGLRETVALLRGLPDPEPPSDLTASVMARIEGGRRPGARRRAFRRLDVPRVALALAAGFAGLAVLSNWQPADDVFPGRAVDPAPEHAQPTRAPGNAADGTTRARRLPVVAQPSAARSPDRPAPRRPAAFGVAPIDGFSELPLEATSNRERELDRQLSYLLGDPSAFLARMGPDARGERFARLAQHAARRQQAGQVASRLIAVPHPLADQLVPRFLAASLAADFERRHPR